MTAEPETIKALETPYHGVVFRSRLEARVAMFLDRLDVAWEYEPTGLNVPSLFPEWPERWYIPDFWLPDLRAWLEVKPGPFAAAVVTPEGRRPHLRDIVTWYSMGRQGHTLFVQAGIPEPSPGEHGGGVLRFAGPRPDWCEWTSCISCRDVWPRPLARRRAKCPGCGEPRDYRYRLDDAYGSARRARWDVEQGRFRDPWWSDVAARPSR